jgi:hypothetical protein
MIRVALILLLFYSTICAAQSNYVMIDDVIPTPKSDDEIEETFIMSDNIGIGIGGRCTTSSDHSYDSHNKKVQDWWDMESKVRAIAFRYDSVNKYYHTTDSLLRLVRSEYYIGIKMNGSLSRNLLGRNQNNLSPEYNFKVGDTAISTSRFRLICSDCPYPKRWRLYYIFYYDKNNLVIRHGLAYLKKGKHSIK